MRAQFALMEAFGAILLLAAVGSYMAGIAYQSSLAPMEFDFGIKNFLYDFPQVAYLNASLNRCILAKDYGCIRQSLSEFNKIYGASGSRLEVNGSSVSSGSLEGCKTSDTECWPMADNSVYIQACLYACGG